MAEIMEKYENAWWGPNGNVWNEKYFPELTNWPEREALEIPILKKLIGSAPKRVLDVPSGFGRISDHLKSDGYDMYGLDVNIDFIQDMRIKGLVNTAVANMASLPLENSSFDSVINVFSSFGYFADRNDDILTFSEFSRVTRKGGSIIFDLQNPFAKMGNFMESWQSKIGDVKLTHKAKFDPVESVIREHITYENGSGKTEFAIINMRVYTPSEIARIGKSLGLKVDKVLSKDGNEYKTSSGRYWIKFVK